MTPRSSVAAALLLALTLSIPGRAAMIDPTRLPASGWTGNVGIPGGIPTDYRMFCNVKVSIPGTKLLAAGNGETDDSPAINFAVQHCSNHRYVYLPAGIYRLDRGIVRQGVNRYDKIQRPFSIEIRGDGPAATKLLFFGHGTAISFVPANGEDGQTMRILGGDARGSTSLRLDSISPYFIPNIYAVIHRLNAQATDGHDPHYMIDTASQMVKVTAIHRASGKISFSPALNEAYPSDYLTIGISAPYRCGIENLYIENRTASGGHNIAIEYGQECWIRNVESNRASKWHIRLQSCARCEVRECYVHDGWDGGGDSIYGVGLFQFCCNNLIENNIAWHCRHSYVTEYGGQGNVFGYNYSKDPINESQLHTDYLMGDLIHHGGEPRWNLWEGNVAADIKFDCVLGGSGYNTAFRNQIQRKGLPITTVANFGSDIQRWNYNENLVGNVYEAPPPGYSGPLRRWGSDQDDTSNLDPRSQATAILDGECDVQQGTVVWAEANHILPDSYYLKAKPAWFGNLAWPPIDPNHPLASGTASIPAGQRWLSRAP
jgi:hypothetical protein